MGRGLNRTLFTDTFQPRFDEERGIYRDCRWCGGKGCLSCPEEADKEYKRQFPDGPQPIASFDLTSATGREAATRALSAEAIESALSEGGPAELIARVTAIAKEIER